MLLQIFQYLLHMLKFFMRLKAFVVFYLQYLLEISLRSIGQRRLVPVWLELGHCDLWILVDILDSLSEL